MAQPTFMRAVDQNIAEHQRVIRAVFDVGLVVRRDFRRALLALGLDYVEDRGWLDSRFVVTGPKIEIQRLYRLARETNSL